MEKKYEEGFAILERIKKYYDPYCRQSEEDYNYAQRVCIRLNGGGYDTPIPVDTMAEWLEKAYKKGKRIGIELDCEFLSGNALKAYLKTHPHNILKAGSRSDQRDGWKFHCIIDDDSQYNEELGF